MTGEAKFMPQSGILSTGKRLLNDSNKGHWLLVIDNADDRGVLFDKNPQAAVPFPLAEYIPKAAHGRVLISSRNNTGMEFVGHPDFVVQVPPFTIHESVELLTHRLTSRAVVSTEAKELVEHLDCIPLAIAQAAACINKNMDWNVRDYLDVFKLEANQAALLGQGEEWHEMSREHGLHNAVFTTWKISFQQIEKAYKPAADLLSMLSVLSRESLPETLIFPEGQNPHQDIGDFDEPYDQHLQQIEQQRHRQRYLERKKALGRLQEYSLVSPPSRDRGTLKWTMHRLVQVCTRDWLRRQSEDRCRYWEKQMTLLLAAKCDWTLEVQSIHRQRLLINPALFPHIINALDYGINVNAEPEIVHAQMKVLRIGGIALYEAGLYHRAVQYLELASQISEQILGRDDLDTAHGQLYLAKALHVTGQFRRAQELLNDPFMVFSKTLRYRKTAYSALDLLNDTKISLSVPVSTQIWTETELDRLTNDGGARTTNVDLL